MITISEENLSIIFSHPVTSKVFLYLRQQKDPAGVRDIQRELHLGSPSTSYWHLNKLLQMNVVKQLPGNKYHLMPEYKNIKRVPLSVVLDHYIIGNQVVPTLFFVLSFNFFIFLTIIVLIFFNLWLQASLIGLLSIGFTTYYIARFYYKFSFKLSEDKQP